MNINRFVSAPKEDIFHSSVYAKAGGSSSFGSTSLETFERRRQLNRNRQAVRGYGGSMIGAGHMREVAQQSMVPPARQQYNSRINSPVVPRRTFVEPRGRGYNPYA